MTAYTCPRCGMVSHNLKDAENRYCGACHRFEEDDAIEFDCCDCGRHVIAWGHHVQRERCNSCFWITQNIAPEQQPEARERLGVPLKRGH
jgi:predicted RNA-binding Zn-ribbon protein involved in translation (DUF1610 family)